MIATSTHTPLFESLAQKLDGELYWDDAMRILYATDASVYRDMPLAVCLPKTKEDAAELIAFANEHSIPLIPRAAGTSLAGQVVGKGLVVDVSKYWTEIIETNVGERWIRVQPGVVRDELNQFLKPLGLMFAPETSTSNRCMIGGMAGNNSCGTHSLVYGSTRDHVLEIEAILSDGSETRFAKLSKQEVEVKIANDSLEGNLYRSIRDTIVDPDNAREIREGYPRPEIHRRNTGYAIDLLLKEYEEGSLNLCKLLCGSEGTLAFFTELKLKLVPLPLSEQAVVAVHLNSIPQAARATLIARELQPRAIELIDDVILNCSKTNIEQSANRFFVKGEPGALLVVEFAAETREEIDSKTEKLETNLREADLGYHFPVIRNQEISKVWALRNAGLGVMVNVPGDRKPVAGIEDTTVHPDDLPEYVDAFLEIMNKRRVESVAYAHIGDGEIHFRPMLDLKLGKDRNLYREISEEVAKLIKRYRGSLSGEHGDGRARAEFIRQMIGDRNYQLCQDIKRTWDPKGIFNPGKIVEAPPIDTDLRYDADQVTNEFATVFDFSDTQGILRMAEKCNGTGACRKTEKIGGTMCPSYMATRNEKDTTRARANILREFLTRSPKENKFDHREIKDVMDLCLSCKGCKSECPSNVDVSRLKAEFLHHYYEANGIPKATRAIGNIAKLYKLGSLFRPVSNFFISSKAISGSLKKMLGIAAERSLPLFSKQTLKSWIRNNLDQINPKKSEAKKTVYLFCDEYTNYTESSIGIAAIELLTSLGYRVEIPDHTESGRAFLSKGMLLEAKKVANRNVSLLKDRVSQATPLLGIEPSCILGFRDEYPDLVDEELKEASHSLSPHCLLIEEFLHNEIEGGNITADSFSDETKSIKLHGHCHQKALSSASITQSVLSLPKNYRVEIIPSGCCGMAGSFGYEKDHYTLSQQVAELVLFPAIRESGSQTTLAAPGTSCRHQIKDGLQVKARHPVEILKDALA